MEEEGSAAEEIIKRRLHDITNRIKFLSSEADSYCKGSDFSINNAQVCASKLENMVKRFTLELNEYFRVSDNQSADEVSEMSSMQLDGEEILAELKHTLDKITNTNNSVEQSRNFSTKLPTLSLPEFSGDVLAWCEFWDIFKSNIHDRPIPDVDKLLYLKSILKEEPRRIIDGLETTNNNYKIAVQLLTERYGKTSLIVDAHYSAISKLKTASSIDECRTIFNDMERHLRVLQSLGEDVTHNHLRHIIKEKFPSDIIYEMQLRKSRDKDDLEEMRRNLEIIISAREEANRARSEADQDPAKKEMYTTRTLHMTDKKVTDTKSKKFKNNFSKIRKHFKGRSVNEPKPSTSDNHKKYRKRKPEWEWKVKNSVPKRGRLSCTFCSEEHFSDQCQKYKTTQDRKALLKGKCFNCFSEGHIAKFCKIKRRCPYCNRDGHNRALCFGKFKPKGETTLATMANDELTLLQTAIVKITNKRDTNTVLECRLLLDSGSQRSYITKEISRKLDLPVVEENNLSIFGFAKETPQEFYSPRVRLEMITRTNKVVELYANEVPTISRGVPSPKMKNEDKTLADDGSLGDRVDILVGNDYYFNLILTEKKRINSNLFMVNSEFGWIVSGRVSSDRKKNEDSLSFITYCQNHDPNCIYFNEPDLPLRNMNISFLWTLESVGIIDNPKTTREEEAISHLNDTIQFVNGRYMVQWPWIEFPPELPTNFGLAYGRLKGLLQRLTENLIKEYQNIFEDQMKNGIIEVIDPEEDVYTQRIPPVHYLAHHMVKQGDKKGRIVYDASGKLKDCKSLNDCMYRGPSMIVDLIALLIQFRTHKVAITADVEKAFLQIGLQTKDRDVTRFLWIKDISKPLSMDNIIHLRFCRIPFGIISSPFILTATLKYHLSQRDSELTSKIVDKCYVDNLVTGTNSTKEAIQLYKTTRKVFSEISMNIRDWISNDETFMETIPAAFRAKQTDKTKILGLLWDVRKDTLKLNIKSEIFDEDNVREPQSKRKILSTIASLYDPCGICAPLIVPSKLLLQQLWEMKLKWDSIIPDELQRKWEDIMHHLEALKEVEIPRYAGVSGRSEKTEFYLHAFSDASKQAYASVIYLVTADGRDKNVSFIMAKAKIVPKEERQNLRMPRLELLGCYLASKLLSYIKNVISIPIKKKTYLWTDSQVVISWIHSNKLLPPFYARRVNTIKGCKDLEVRYIDSESNPADLATRPELWHKKKTLWLHGPEFLNNVIPKCPLWQGPSETNTLEVTSFELTELDSEIINNHSNNQEESNENQRQGEVKCDRKIIQEIQKVYFPQEYKGEKTNLAISLDLFKDIDGLLRCKGRMKNANWSFDKCHPILIPRDDKFTNDLVMKIHKTNHHMGANHTLCKIRELYWIPRGKAYVQRMLKKCPECVKHSGGPFKLPPAPALPAERVNYAAPFTYIGVDYMGPLIVNNGTGNCKRWVCIYTCLVIRAIHLEVVADLTAEETLLSLRRVISIRGVPELVISDNALYFKLLAETLSTQHCIDKKIKWKFITPLTPWAGGFYKRLIGIVKNCLRKTLGKQMLKDNQLVTIMKEIEATINSRPLTSVDSEMDYILKPSDFLTVGRTITLNDSDKFLEPLDASKTKTELIRGWKRARIILNEFKDMFNNRYLLSLRERYHHLPREPRVTSKLTPEPGQVVQIKGDSRNRNDWKVGKIATLIPSADGACRAAEVQVGNKRYMRSIAHLYPLEIEEAKIIPLTETPELVQDNTSQPEYEVPEGTIDANIRKEENMNVSPTDHNDELLPNAIESNSSDLTTRPRREAAVKALEKIKDWTRDLTSFLLYSSSSPSRGSVASSE